MKPFSMRLGAMTIAAIVGLVMSHTPAHAKGTKKDKSKVSVTWTSPVAGTTFTAPINITLTASAFAKQSNHPIVEVEFFNGDSLIGRRVTPTNGNSYQLNWLNVPPGTYRLTAAATNNKDDYDETEPITITVGKGSQLIRGFNPATPITYAPNATFALTASGGASGNPVTFASATPSVCIVTGNIATVQTAGICSLTAAQAGDGNHNAAPQAVAAVTITKATQSITGLSPTSPITYSSGGTFTLSATGGASNNPVAFASTTPVVCSVNGDTATVLSAGICSLTAEQAGNTNYNAAPQATATVTINKDNQTITRFTPPSSFIYAANATFVLTAMSGASDNPVIFASTTPTVCSVIGNTATILSAGICSLTADQAGNTNYNAAPQATATVTITKANQTITGFNPATPITYALNMSFALTASGGASGNAITFASTTASVCTTSGSNGATLTIQSAGTCTVTADQAGSAGYTAAPQVTTTITINKANQSITGFNPASPITFAVAPNNTFGISATAGASTSPVVFSTTSPTICMAGGTNGATVTVISAGVCSLTANQAGDGNYSAAAQVAASVTINKAAQTITGFAPASPIIFAPSPNNTFTLTVTSGGASNNPFTFASITPTVCSVIDNIATVLSAGTCTITADQAGNTNYNAAQQTTATVLINKANQTITGFAPAVSIAFAPAPNNTLALSATGGGSGNPVTFASTTPAVCTTSGTNGATVTMLSAGTCTITADQAGNASYTAAPQVTSTITINKASQTINMGAIASQELGAMPVNISAEASSGLAISFAVNTPETCGASTTTSTSAASTAAITVLTAGTCAVTARQSGNSNYAAAADVVQSFVIAPRTVALTSGLKFWYHTTNNIHRRNVDTDSNDFTIAVSPATNTVLQLYAEEAGAVWVLGTERLQRFSDTGTIDVDVALSSISSKPILAMALDPYNERLVGRTAKLDADIAAVQGRLITLNPQGQKVAEWPIEDQIRRFSIEADQSIWVLGNSRGHNFAPDGTLIGFIPFQADMLNPTLMAVDVAEQIVWLGQDSQLMGIPYAVIPPVPAAPSAVATKTSAAQPSSQNKAGGGASYGIGTLVRVQLPPPLVVIDLLVPFYAKSVMVLAASPTSAAIYAYTTQGNTIFGTPISVNYGYGPVAIAAVPPPPAVVAPTPAQTTVAVTYPNRVVAVNGAGSTVATTPVSTTPIAPAPVASPPRPVLSIVSPANGTSGTYLTAIPIVTTATVAVNTISRVEFIVNNVTNTINKGQSGNSGDTYQFNYAPLAVGPITITIRAVDNRGITSAASTVTLNVGKANQIITGFTSNPMSPIGFAASPNNTAELSAIGGLTGNAVVFSSNTPAICTTGNLNGQRVTFIGAGNCSVSASQAGSSNYNPASATLNIIVTPGAQVIQFAAPTQASGGAGDTFPLAAIGGQSGNPVIFGSTTPATCTVTNQAMSGSAPNLISNAIVTIVNIGVCGITTSQAGSSNYNAAVNVTASIALTGAVAKLYYIHADHLGTPRVITNAADNTKVWEWKNEDAFGNNAPNENPAALATLFQYNLRFPGQYFDLETNTYYNYFRDYDPTTGRYVQSDPIGLMGGISTYGYVEGSPLSFIDPYGLQAWINAPPFYPRPSQPGPAPLRPSPNPNSPGPAGKFPPVNPEWRKDWERAWREGYYNLVCVEWSCPIPNRNPNACYPPGTPERTTGPWASAPGAGPNFEAECRCVRRDWDFKEGIPKLPIPFTPRNGM